MGPSLVGKTLGNYRITQKLGQGGVGDVWKAVDLSLDRTVALKILRPELGAMPEVIARFRSEALALARLNHPNVATIYGFNEDAETPFIAMELVFGQTLQVLVRGFGPMRSARALPLYFQVLDAIQHAHDHGIVHRDLKASNVMLTQLGVVKMLDFGISRIVGSAQLTQGSHSIGTPAWMAPEQVLAQEADVRTDVYALGLLLYWLVTAHLPFEAGSPHELQRAHVEDAPPSPRQFTPDLPESIEKAILRALAKQRQERFAGVAELRDALSEGFVPDLTVPMRLETSDEVIVRQPPLERLGSDTGAVLTLSEAETDVASAPAWASGWPRRLAFALLGSLAVAIGVLLLRAGSPSPVAAPVPAPVVLRDARAPAPDTAPSQSAPAQSARGEQKATRKHARPADRWTIRRQ